MKRILQESTLNNTRVLFLLSGQRKMRSKHLEATKGQCEAKVKKGLSGREGAIGEGKIFGTAPWNGFVLVLLRAGQEEWCWSRVGSGWDEGSGSAEVLPSSN